MRDKNGTKALIFNFFHLKSDFIGFKFKMNKTFISNTRAIQASLSH
jgi:hypothetical protein